MSEDQLNHRKTKDKRALKEIGDEITMKVYTQVGRYICKKKTQNGGKIWTTINFKKPKNFNSQSLKEKDKMEKIRAT